MRPMHPPVPTPDRLATWHLGLTMAGGVAFALPLTLALAVIQGTRGDYTVGATWLGMVAGDWIALLFPLLGVAILPALLTGWLRLGTMRRLLAYCQGVRPIAGQGLAVLGTLLLFELCVVPAALFGWAMERGAAGSLGGWYIACAGISLPWLLAALASAWWVLRGRSVAGDAPTLPSSLPCAN